MDPEPRPVGMGGPPVRVTAGQPLGPVLASLRIPRPRAVLVLVGWAGTLLDSGTQDSVDLLIRDAVLPLCLDEDVVLVSGGTDAGVMAAAGRAATDLACDESRGGRAPVLVGVAPAAKVTGSGEEATTDVAEPEPAHRLILTDGDNWGDESTVLVGVAEAVAQGRPIVVLAVGGGTGTVRELTMAVRRSWPVLLVTTGREGTSDLVARELGLLDDRNAASEQATGGSSGTDEHPAGGATDTPPVGTEADRSSLRGAEARGLIRASPIGARAEVDRLLRWRLSSDGLLREAWTRFATADELAGARRPLTDRLAGAGLVLAAATAIVAVLAAVVQESWLHVGLRVLVTALPLAAVATFGLMERRNRTGSWVALRSSAEATIREIYLYRARAGEYGQSPSAPERFAAMLATLESGTDILRERSPVRRNEGWPPEGLMTRVPAADRLLGPLTAQAYNDARACDQLGYFDANAARLDRQSTYLAVTVYVFTGCAGLALALSWKWETAGLGLAAAFTAIAAAFLAWREFRQFDQQLAAWMLTAAALRAARGRWLALDPEAAESRAGLASFVGEAEAALAAEGSEWARRLLQAHLAFVEGRKAG